MKVKQLMSKKVTAVTTKTLLRDLWKAIFKKRVHALPVIDSGNKLIGIIAEEDLLKPLYPDYAHLVESFVSSRDFEDMEDKVEDLTSLTARDLMNKHVIFTREETPILRALSRMIVRNVRQLPVVTEDLTLIGVVSKGDIFDHLFTKHLRVHSLVKKNRV